MAGKRINYICYLCGKQEKQRILQGEPPAGVCPKDDNGGRHLWIDGQYLDFHVRQQIKKGIASMNGSDMYFLGQYYATEGSPQYNRENAMLWYQKSADAGHVEAMLWLGKVYMNGIDVEQDEIQAIQWYQKAAEIGSHEAMLVLAHVYEEGNGVPSNKSVAMDWYRKIAYETVSPPCFAIGGCGFGGMLWDGFITEVMRQTDGNTPYGMVQRGYAYENGIAGVEKDMYQAVSWYKKAAEAGEHFALLKLADAYVSGKFIEQNEEKALMCYREVAEENICSW